MHCNRMKYPDEHTRVFTHTDLKVESREEAADSEATVGRRPSMIHSSETKQGTLFFSRAIVNMNLCLTYLELVNHFALNA